MGAGVALQLAANRPDLVAAVCCIDGGLLDPRIMFGPDWPTARAAMHIDRRTAPTAAMLGAWAHGNGLPDAAMPALLANYQPNHGDRDRLQLILTADREEPLARSLWHQEPAELLTQISAPVMAMMARAADPEQVGRRRNALRRTVDRAGRSVIEVWIDGGHDLPLQRPRPVAAAIIALTSTTRNHDEPARRSAQ